MGHTAAVFMAAGRGAGCMVRMEPRTAPAAAAHAARCKRALGAAVGAAGVGGVAVGGGAQAGAAAEDPCVLEG